MENSNEGNWYAIQLASGALLPAKQAYIEVGPRDGRYLKRRALDRSVICNSCERAGVELYVPVERYSFIHHRSKKLVERERALIPGYAFVQGVTDFQELENLEGVAGVMTNGAGQPPTIIPPGEVENLKRIEGEIFELEKKKRADREFQKKKITRRQLSKIYPSGQSFAVKPGHFLEGKRGKIVGHTGRKEIKAVIDLLNKMVKADLRIHQRIGLQRDEVGRIGIALVLPAPGRLGVPLDVGRQVVRVLREHIEGMIRHTGCVVTREIALEVT